MWYVVDCEEGAYLYYGFNREVSKEEFAERIKKTTRFSRVSEPR